MAPAVTKNGVKADQAKAYVPRSRGGGSVPSTVVATAPQAAAGNDAKLEASQISQLGGNPGAPMWTPKKRFFYVSLAILRTLLYTIAVNVILFCSHGERFGGIIATCHLHHSLQNKYLAVGWLGVTNLGNFLWFLGSMHNGLFIKGAKVEQSSFSNNAACLAGAMVFASMGLSMGAVGVWWGLLIIINFFFGPFNILLLNGRKVLTKKLMWNLLFRFLHTWDVVTDFATSAIIGASSAKGIVYLLLSLMNLAFYITSLYTNISEESLLRICLNCTKAFGLDIPMCVIDIVLLFEVEGDGKRAVIVISALSSLLEVAGSVKAGIAFHAVSRQHTAMRRSSAIARDIAFALARFDLEGAERCVQRGGLDVRLNVAFRMLLANLKLYKPYLPDAMFSGSKESAPKGPNTTIGATSASATATSTLTTERTQRRKLIPRNGGSEPPPGQETPNKTVDDEVVSDEECLRVPQGNGDNPLLVLEPIALSLPGAPILPASLIRKNIAVLVIRMQTRPKPPSEMTRQAVLESTSAFLSTVFLEAKLYRGVLHSFDTGYEVVVTFGAADGTHKNNTEVADAYKCAVALHKALETESHGAVNIGLSSGVSVVGNLGTANRLAFSVVGDVIPQARQACTAAALFEHAIVAAADFRFSFTYLTATPIEEAPLQSAGLQLFSLPLTSRQYCMSQSDEDDHELSEEVKQVGMDESVDESDIDVREDCV